ncbi:MAG: hypothetical protein CMP47_14610 [Rickettsiales bacterium]|nr:hypothetical protein [Rickettsiales bacterium]
MIEAMLAESEGLDTAECSILAIESAARGSNSPEGPLLGACKRKALHSGRRIDALRGLIFAAT